MFSDLHWICLGILDDSDQVEDAERVGSWAALGAAHPD